VIHVDGDFLRVAWLFVAVGGSAHQRARRLPAGLLGGWRMIILEAKMQGGAWGSDILGSQFSPGHELARDRRILCAQIAHSETICVSVVTHIHAIHIHMRYLHEHDARIHTHLRTLSRLAHTCAHLRTLAHTTHNGHPRSRPWWSCRSRVAGLLRSVFVICSCTLIVLLSVLSAPRPPPQQRHETETHRRRGRVVCDMIS